VTETGHNRIAMLRDLERGEFRPSLYLALRIAEFFEVPMEVVFSTRPFPRLGADPGSE
jgi:DNA-binding XRE family transcriptional regulator